MGIVKSDPPAVFIPQRLREVLKFQHVTQNGIFLENCKDTRMSLHGSLEVMSNTAFGTFLDHIEDCLDVLPWQNASYAHFRYYGEDAFHSCLQDCKEVGRMLGEHHGNQLKGVTTD